MPDAAASGLEVREMRLDEVDIRIDYFLGADDEHLQRLGVDRDRLPAREDWRASYAADDRRAISERENYSLVWLLDGGIVGFSSTDGIAYGDHAYMHLHILRDGQRRAGMGAQFVRLSAALYFDVLALRELYCRPNAFNVAPNRTLQRAGFSYVETRELRPSPMNTVQPVTCWMLAAPPPEVLVSRSGAFPSARSPAAT